MLHGNVCNTSRRIQLRSHQTRVIRRLGSVRRCLCPFDDCGPQRLSPPASDSDRKLSLQSTKHPSTNSLDSATVSLLMGHQASTRELDLGENEKIFLNPFVSLEQPFARASTHFIEIAPRP
jgi:hypothetical protein